MALLVSVQLDSGMTISNSYAKIGSFSGDKNLLSIELQFFLDKEKADSNNYSPMTVKVYSFTPSVADDSNNWLKQAYEYLKTLDEYQNAIDVFEEGQLAV